jgi:hypothetical protein
MKKFFKKIMSSYQPILILLIILVVVLIIYTQGILSKHKTYLFYASDDYVSIYNGVINLDYDMNVFVGSNNKYMPTDDVKVKSYKIGYYVKVNDKYKELIITEDSDDDGFSLKNIIESTTSFNFTSLWDNEKFLNKEKIKALDNGLYFIIEATTIKDETIYNKTDITLSKVSK